MATSTSAMVDAESWGEHVTAAHQISTLSKWRPNSDKGLSCALWYFWAFLFPAAVVVEGHQSDLLKVPFFITKEEYTKFVTAKRKASLAGCKNNVFSSWKSYLI